MNRAQEIAWAAGLMEGEGCFTRLYQRKRGTKYPCVCIGMTDKDPVVDVARILGGGGHLRRRERGGVRKPCWMWQIVGSGATRVMRLLLPYMKKRRSARIRQLLRGDLRTVAETAKARKRKK